MELLYVDEPRLRSYYSQLKVKSRRLPTFSTAVGLTGPQIGASWGPQPDQDVLSMLNQIRIQLQRSGMFARSRPSEQDRWDLGRPRDDLPTATQGDLWAIFREELVELRTAFIKPNPDSAFLKDGLTLWIATADGAPRGEPDVLLLIQQFPFADKPFAAAASGYSMLSMEAEAFGLPAVSGIGANPVKALATFGALIGPPKVCTVLYRVRATFAEPSREFSLTTVGYPLGIWRS